MKKVFLFISLFSLLISKAQTQDSIYFWKNGAMIHKRSIKTADLDSISFKRPVINLPSVTICNQVWTTQNLNVSTYSDGTPIPQVTDPTQWVNLTTGAWCYYNNDPVNGPIYGKLYNWYAVAGIYDAASASNPALRKKLAPMGWHIPNDAEWSSLINCLDPNANGGNISPNFAGGKMKTIGTIQAGTGLWQSPNTGATNESGFTGLPAGSRYTNGTFIGVGMDGNWWGSSEVSSTIARGRSVGYSFGGAFRYDDSKNSGYSVRCVRD